MLSEDNQKSFVPTPSREERRTQFGIDCAELVHFTHWEPGGEHIKHLIVKNVVMKTQKIRYRLPKTKYFSLEFPETQTLSAGMSWTIPITFRPVAKENYNDVIEFSTSFGRFYLPVKASLPEHVIESPDFIDFGLCPARETAQKTFQMHNTGKLQSYFEWEINEPFYISPRSGLLPPGSSCTVTVEFKPKEAMVLTGKAVCSFGDKENWEKTSVSQATTVYAISKYSHITVQDNIDTFDFGSAFVGQSVERILVIENYSAVQANFKIRKAEKDTDPYFDFSVLSGTIPSKSKIEITMTYTPAAPELKSNAYFDIITMSGNTLRIKCSGSGISPRVSLSPEVLNFNDTPAGKTVVRALYLTNDTDVATFYQFDCERSSMFLIDKPFGIINAHSQVALTVKFSPVDPINYYRRVYCLVEHQDVISVELLGTCYNDKRRPATFKHHHVLNYEARVLNGLVEYGPDQLEEYLNDGTIKSVKGVLEFVKPDNPLKMQVSNNIDFPYDNGKGASAFFYENNPEFRACSLVDTHVDFGSCSRYRVIEPQTLRIRNNTLGRMSCVWILPGEQWGEECPFSVSPRTLDIGPKSVAEFRVNFRPTVDNSFYGAQLECFVYFKNMRNFRLVNEETFTPPWCLTPSIAGNTFPPGRETFIPKVNFSSARLDFPACHVDKSVYRTVKVTNSGDTSVKFSFVENQIKSSLGIGGDTPLASLGGATFSMKPRVGVLHKNEVRLIVFRFSPGEQRDYDEDIVCYFNSLENSSHLLQMRGAGYYPQIFFDPILSFKPTAIGAIAGRRLKIRNNSKIQVYFQWNIPKQHSSVVSISPLSGYLAPNDQLDLQVTFAPSVETHYTLKIPCSFYHEHEDASFANKRQTLTILGKAIHGSMTVQPEIVEFGTILVNTIVERDLTLFNPSECDLFYTLQVFKDGQLMSNNLKTNEIEVIQKSKILPARSNVTVKIRACVRHETDFEYSIVYKPDTRAIAHEEGLSIPELLPKEPESKRLCSVKGTGVHPLLKITDIRTEGYSKTILWHMFSLTQFNKTLAQTKQDPFAYAEHALDDDSFPTDSLPQLTAEDTDIDFDFGAAPVGSRPALIYMAMKNDGVVAVDWVFQFLNDLAVDMENWADPGNYSDEQMHQNFILDNNIFTVTPRHGTLEPGQKTRIVLSYSHEFSGAHALPVVFRLKNGASRAGKQVVINFTGYSVPPTQKFLHLKSNYFELNPVKIGMAVPPIQTYHFMNTSAINLDYELDTTAIDRLNQDNMNFQILQCLTTKGTIGPGQIAYLEFVFHPLETKRYEIDIPITVKGGKTKLITLYGYGYKDSIVPYESKLDPKDLEDAIPSSQEACGVVKQACLSDERISFGHIPVNTLQRRIVVVSNVSDSRISFKWQIPPEWPQDVIKIVPETGKLQPNESKVCKIIFTPNSDPRMWEFDVICETMNDDDLEKYNAQVEQLKKAISEGRALTSLPLLHSKRGSSAEISKMKYRALPSISKDNGDYLAVDGSANNLDKIDRIAVPKPSTLFLGIKAQSYLWQEFADRFSGVEIFYSLPKPTKKEELMELDLIENVLDQLMNDVYNDKDVQELPLKIFNEPCPFYDQIAPHPRGVLTNLQTQLEEDKEVIKLPEFQNLVESALEGTIYNLMQEVSQGVFQWHKYPMLIRDQ